MIGTVAQSHAIFKVKQSIFKAYKLDMLTWLVCLFGSIVCMQASVFRKCDV